MAMMADRAVTAFVHPMTTSEARVIERFNPETCEQAALLPADRAHRLRAGLAAIPHADGNDAIRLLAAIWAAYPLDPIHEADDSVIDGFRRQAALAIAAIPLDMVDGFPSFVTDHHDQRAAPNIARLKKLVSAYVAPRERVLARLAMMEREAERRARDGAESARIEQFRNDVREAGGLLAYWSNRPGPPIPPIIIRMLEEHQHDDEAHEPREGSPRDWRRLGGVDPDQDGSDP